MSYKVETTEDFNKEAKSLIKKYPSLKTELKELYIELLENPSIGTPLGKNVFKIRLSIASKNKGKPGGAKVIIFIKIINETIYLLTIYNKGEKESISTKEIEELLKDYK